MPLISRSNFIVISLLSLATGSQLIKQVWLAGMFNPQVFAGWATAVLASQLLFNFGGLGFHNFSARQAALYESRGKKLLTNSLVTKQLLIYTYLLPLSIPVIYFLVAEPEPIFFAVMVFYALANVFLNAVTCPIYVRSSLTFSSIQGYRGFGSAVIAVSTCYYTDSLLFTLINESLFVLALGFLTFKNQRIKWYKRYMILGSNCKALVPFFLPVILATVSISLSRLIAIDILNDELLGIYYFIFLIVSCGLIFQYGLSVFFGPVITSKLEANSSHELSTFIFKCWVFLLLIALLVGLIGYLILPNLVEFFYAEYSPGIILILPMLCLAMAKMCDIWSIYFLLGGLEKYLYLPHLMAILIVTVIYLVVEKNDNFSLMDMRFFVFGEALAIFLTPLIVFFWVKHKFPAV